MSHAVEVSRVNNPARWRDACETIDGAGLFHDPRWARLWRRVFGEEMVCLIASEGSRPVAMLPMVRRRAGPLGHYWISVPYFDAAGPVGDPECFPALIQAAEQLRRDRGDDYAEIRSPFALDTQWQLDDHKQHVVLRLPDTEETLFAGFKSKLRSQVRRAEREEPTHEIDGLSLVPTFHDVYSHRMWELGSPCQPRRLFRALLETFPAEAAVLVVRLRGRPVAGAFLLRDRDRVLIPWASTLSEVNRLSMNMVLYARALSWAVQRGATSFDFGRSDAGSSQIRFKRQWGGEARGLHWYREPGEHRTGDPSRARALAQRLWQKLPLPVTRVLGPTVIPYFS
ncbi:MAG: GNAT family N-acetyltransferase [Myxococcota bacterium]